MAVQSADSINADTRPRSGPYRLSCPSRLKTTRDPRDEKDERDDSEVADNARQCGALDSDNADYRTTYYPYYPHYPIIPILPIRRTAIFAQTVGIIGRRTSRVLLLVGSFIANNHAITHATHGLHFDAFVVTQVAS